MSQILNIFRKDIRHHWPEISVSIAFLIAYTADQPRLWAHRPPPAHIPEFLLSSLPVLLVITWLFLVVRVVQDETLVGDRQFWITRPYEWPKLLAAKLFSIFLFIHLPLFLAQLLLLSRAHFPVASSIGGILTVHCYLALTLILGVLALSAVTSGIGQAAVVLLATVVVLIGISTMTSVLPNFELASDSTDSVQACIFIFSCLGVVLLQYARRKTVLSRLWLAGIPCSIFLLILVTPYGTIVARSFLLPTKDHPASAQFDLDPTLVFTHAAGALLPANYSGDVGLEIPLRVSSQAEGTLIQIRGARLDLQLRTGQSWTSNWHWNVVTILPGRTMVWPSFSVKRSFFDAAGDQRVKTHLSLAANVYRVLPGTHVIVTNGEFSIPSGARCSRSQDSGLLLCFAALAPPHPVLITADLPSRDCPLDERDSHTLLSASPASFENLGTNSGPDFFLSPVEEFTISLSKLHVTEDLSLRPPLCAGTHLSFSTPNFTDSERAEIDLGTITLSDYVPTYPRDLQRVPR
ncbi:MAG: hypothetical protein WBG02_21445 [Candidatus Acidiferrum sp.]